MRALDYSSDYSIYGRTFTCGKEVWVVELAHYETHGDEVSVRTSIWQGEAGVEPSVFPTKAAAEKATKALLESGTTLHLLGFSVKKITLVR